LACLAPARGGLDVQRGRQRRARAVAAGGDAVEGGEAAAERAAGDRASAGAAAAARSAQQGQRAEQKGELRLEGGDHALRGRSADLTTTEPRPPAPPADDSPTERRAPTTLPVAVRRARMRTDRENEPAYYHIPAYLLLPRCDSCHRFLIFAHWIDVILF